MATINLTWTASVPAPVSGYRIKYWRTTNPGTVFTVSPNVTGTSYSITGVQDASNYSGTIEASCSGGAYSTPVNWNVTAVTMFYYYYATTFDCSNSCAQISPESSVVVVSATPLTVGTFYKMNTTVYRLDTAEPFTNGAVDISNYTGSGSTCTAACGGGAGAPQYAFYTMDEIDCTTGNLITADVVVAFADANYVPAIHRYFKPTGGGGSVYHNNTSTPATNTSTAPILVQTAYPSYFDACDTGIIPDTCLAYTIRTGISNSGGNVIVTWTDCNGTVHTNEYVENGSQVCCAPGTEPVIYGLGIISGPPSECIN